jgi:hypothetical protein
MRAICCVAALVLGLVLAALGYRVIFAGAVTPAPDGRSAILLNAGERDLVLTEMRAFLQAVQGIVQAVSAGDPAGAAQAARAVGSAGTAEVPISLMAKLPIGFKQLGMATHGAFDQLALDAESLADLGHTQAQLADLLQNCVGCHAAFRIDLEP